MIIEKQLFGSIDELMKRNELKDSDVDSIATILVAMLSSNLTSLTLNTSNIEDIDKVKFNVKWGKSEDNNDFVTVSLVQKEKMN